MITELRDTVYIQREQLARILHKPMANLAFTCLPIWQDRHHLNTMLIEGFDAIPHATSLYCLDSNGRQISDTVCAHDISTEFFGHDRSDQPYMKENLPGWGFLLSDAYIGQTRHHLSLTALQQLKDEDSSLGFLGADFDLRNLPAATKLYDDSCKWRQVKGDPAIRGLLFQQSRAESLIDRNLDQVMSIFEELITQHGVFQCQIHFSSSQSTIWFVDEPYNYRMLDPDALGDIDICLAYPSCEYPANAVVPQAAIAGILGTLPTLRMTDANIYLRAFSLNIINGIVSVTFSCDGTHYMRFDEFLGKSATFWFGSGEN